VAEQLEQSDSDVLVRAGNQKSDLNDQYDRIAEYDFEKGHQKSGDVSIG